MILSTVHQVLRSRVGSCWYSLTEKGGRIPQNMELGTLMQTAPPYFAIFLNFKHRRLLAVNAAKRYSQNTSFQVTFSGKGLSPLPVSFPVGGGLLPYICTSSLTKSCGSVPRIPVRFAPLVTGCRRTVDNAANCVVACRRITSTDSSHADMRATTLLCSHARHRRRSSFLISSIASASSLQSSARFSATRPPAARCHAEALAFLSQLHSTSQTNNEQ